MPIEFNCSGCSALIRVPDTAAGQSARCPSCESVSSVPATTPTGDSNPFAETTAGNRPPPPPSQFEATSAPVSGNPYSAPVAPTTAPQPQFHQHAGVGPSAGDSMPLADRGARLVAKIVDGLVVVGPLILSFIVAGVFGAVFEGEDIGGILAAISMVIGFVAMAGLAIYNMILMSSRGETIGKRMMGIRVILDRDGTPPGFVNGVLLRSWLMALLNQVPFLGLVDALMIFGEKQQCLHDLIASTRVVAGRYPN